MGEVTRLRVQADRRREEKVAASLSADLLWEARMAASQGTV